MSVNTGPRNKYNNEEKYMHMYYYISGGNTSYTVLTKYLRVKGLEVKFTGRLYSKSQVQRSVPIYKLPLELRMSSALTSGLNLFILFRAYVSPYLGSSRPGLCLPLILIHLPLNYTILPRCKL